jgi:hypothetical protein
MVPLGQSTFISMYDLYNPIIFASDIAGQPPHEPRSSTELRHLFDHSEIEIELELLKNMLKNRHLKIIVSCIHAAINIT